MNNDFEDDEVKLAIRGLLAQCNSLSLECLKDPDVQNEFRRQYIHIGKCLKADYDEGIISKDEVVQYVRKERRSLIDQARDLSLYGIGVIGGIAQATGGAVMCASAPLTTIAGVALCATVGTPMMAHGVNNTYENSANIMDYLRGEQEIKNTGFVRQGYHLASKHLGYSNREADLAYSMVDLGLSAYGLTSTLKKVPYANVPDATQFKLFRSLASDYEKGWRTMGGGALAAEVLGNSYTIDGMYKTYNE
ncbi:DUF4225 domain-containing protein [Aliivibrio sifiae]